GARCARDRCVHRRAAAECGVARGRAAVGGDRVWRAAALGRGRRAGGARGRHGLLLRRRRRRGEERQRPAGHRGRGARRDRAQGRGAVHATTRGAHRARARAGARTAPAGDARGQGARTAGAFRMIRIHNSLTGEKQELRPITPGSLRMYVCGLTVYDYVHIGHARMLIVFDVVSRYLRHRGYRLSYVRNITDIDDKIIRRAAENGETTDALTARFITAMHEDATQLGVLPPDEEPRATQYVPEIIAMVQEPIEGGHAYVAADGDVLYSVSSFGPYGRLSGKVLADLRAGARVEVDAGKRDPLDFVLWKQAKPGEPWWDSPWGRGRPGWHIECSAMSTALLGTHFDIHGGGMDLKFPHHENEIAQSCAATGDEFVNLWMHNGFVNV